MQSFYRFHLSNLAFFAVTLALLGTVVFSTLIEHDVNLRKRAHNKIPDLNHSPPPDSSSDVEDASVAVSEGAIAKPSQGHNNESDKIKPKVKGKRRTKLSVKEAKIRKNELQMRRRKERKEIFQNRFQSGKSEEEIAIIEKEHESIRQRDQNYKSKTVKNAWARIKDGKATENDEKLRQRSRDSKSIWRARHYNEYIQKRRQWYEANKEKAKSYKIKSKLRKANAKDSTLPRK